MPVSLPSAASTAPGRASPSHTAPLQRPHLHPLALLHARSRSRSGCTPAELLLAARVLTRLEADTFEHGGGEEDG
eukprot:3159478-Rhodomonas_salina.1